MEAVQTINMIAIDPRVRGGHPYVLGTTITVADIAITKVYHGLDADGIADWYGLTLPQVYSALAYYYEFKAKVDEQIQTQIRRAEGLKEKRVGGENSLLPG